MVGSTVVQHSEAATMNDTNVPAAGCVQHRAARCGRLVGATAAALAAADRLIAFPARSGHGREPQRLERWVGLAANIVALKLKGQVAHRLPADSLLSICTRCNAAETLLAAGVTANAPSLHKCRAGCGEPGPEPRFYEHHDM